MCESNRPKVDERFVEKDVEGKQSGEDRAYCGNIADVLVPGPGGTLRDATEWMHSGWLQSVAEQYEKDKLRSKP